MSVPQPQFSPVLPRPRSGCVESIGYFLHRFLPATRMRSGACMLDTYMRIASTHSLLDRILSQVTWAAQWSDAAFTARHRSTRDLARQHPCWLAAFFLPCARPPDARPFASTDYVHAWYKDPAIAPTHILLDRLLSQETGFIYPACGLLTFAPYTEWDSSTIAVSAVDPRSAASNRWGTVFTVFQRAPPRSSKCACSTGPLAPGAGHILLLSLMVLFIF